MNYYDLLGVPKTASENEIKKAYRKCVKKWHPDRNLSASEEEKKKLMEMFTLATKAYDTLINPVTRASYDTNGATEQAPQEPAKPSRKVYPFFENYKDIFAPYLYTLFEEEPRGQDVTFNIEVDFVTAYTGGEVLVILPDKELVVNIPRGINTGMKVRLPKMGATTNGASGNLFLQFSVMQKLGGFTREGLTLHMELPLSINEAYEGGEISLLLPDRSEINVTVPPHTQSDSVLSVENRGFASTKNPNDVGWLLLHPVIVIPESIDSDTLRNLYNAYTTNMEKTA